MIDGNQNKSDNELPSVVEAEDDHWDDEDILKNLKTFEEL